MFYPKGASILFFVPKPRGSWDSRQELVIQTLSESSPQSTGRVGGQLIAHKNLRIMVLHF